ncbi:MAG TPA: hypothetical protein VKC34_18085 [Blastocatellia bacterium]|nr:hypothetical protein [Blastocatellia bacterium]
MMGSLRAAAIGVALLITLLPPGQAARADRLNLGPGEDMLTPEEGGIIQDWSGKLPVSGDYSVQVYTKGAGGNYTLEVTVR